MIDVEIADSVAPLAAEWDALAERLRAGPFVSPDWVAAHWSCFGSGRLAIVAVRRDRYLGAVLPVARRGNTARSVTNGQTPQFGVLAEVLPSPVVELNRAVAVSMAHGPQAGLDLVDELAAEPALRGYHLLPSVRGDLLRKLGRTGEARAEFERAAALTSNERERRLSEERARAAADDT